MTSGAVVDVDGVAENDESVLVEIFAHQGMLKGGQRHKIANDVLTLITIARDRELKPRLVLAFADPAMTTYLAGKSWLAAAIHAWGVEVVIAKLDDAVLEGLRAAQLRQVMMNPPAGADS